MRVTEEMGSYGLWNASSVRGEPLTTRSWEGTSVFTQEMIRSDFFRNVLIDPFCHVAITLVPLESGGFDSLVLWYTFRSKYQALLLPSEILVYLNSITANDKNTVYS